MSRQVVVDTETTGLDPAQGHRVIEVGCVELVDRRLTGRHFHRYLQPDHPIDEGARQVHGITDEFLADKPRFGDVAEALLDFLRGAELIIHNAPFDVGFINNELARMGGKLGRLEAHCTVLDTLALARQLHPGQRNSLDALCRRYEVDDSQRDLHGALLDAEILADVYLAMTGGQVVLELDADRDEEGAVREVGHERAAGRTVGELVVIRASAEERAAHARRLDAIDERSGGSCVWRRLDS